MLAGGVFTPIPRIMGPLRLHTLGGLRLTCHDGELLAGRRKLLALFAYLALRSPRPISRTELATLLWGESPEPRARQSLRQALAQLRKVCGDLIQIDGDLVALAGEEIQIDLHQFEAELSEHSYAQAVDYWQGDFLAGADDLGGEVFSEWVEIERARLRRLATSAFTALTEVHMRRGEWHEAAEVAGRWVVLLPLDERAYIAWIRALHLSGRTTEARSRYAELTARLREELGRSPSPEAQRLGEVSEEFGAERVAPSPELVGRADAFATLVAARRSAESGAVAIVVAEEGYGKTRLCEEFLRWVIAESPSTFTLRARAFEGERGAHFAALRELLGPLGGAPGLGGSPDDVLGRISALAPSIRDRFRALPEPTSHLIPVSSWMEPHQVSTDLARVLGDIAAEVPIVVLLDDLHLADPSTRAVLLALARRPPEGVLILLTGWISDLEVDPELAEIRTQPDCYWLELDALSLAEVESMIARDLDLDDVVRSQLTERLYLEGGGDPYFTTTLLEALAEGGWTGPGEADLPSPAELRGVVRTRLDRLSEGAREVAEAAALLTGPTLSGPIPPALLAEVTGLSSDHLARAIDELFAHHILREIRETIGGARAIDFIHGWVRRATLDLLNPARRAVLEGAGEAALARTRGHRLLTGIPKALRRRVALAGALAIALVAAAGGVVFTLSDRGNGGISTAGVVAVLPFSVRGAPEFGYLTEGMVDLLSTNLEGAGELRSADPHAVLGALRDERAGELGPEEGLAIARRLGAGLYVLGSVVEAGGGLRVQAGLYDDRGDLRTMAEAAAGDEAGLFELVDELARKLLVGRYSSPGDRLIRLAATTTHSISALKAYLTGESAFRAGRYGIAVDAFRDAARIDTTFALAYYRLAVASEWHSLASPGEIEGALARAVQHADRLPARDRRFLEAIAAYHRGRAIEAEAWFRAILATDPDDVQGWFGLAEILFHARSRSGRPRAIEDARRAFERVVELDPDHEEALLHLVRIYAQEGRLTALDSTIDRLEPMIRRGGAVAEAVLALRAVVSGDREGERRIAAQLTDAPPILAFVPIAFTAVYGRDINAAMRLAQTLTEPHRGARVRGAAHALLAEFEIARGDWDAAIAELDRAEPLNPRLTLQYRALLAFAPGSNLSDDEVRAILRRLQEVTLRGEADPHAEPGTPVDIPFLTHHPGLEEAIDTYLIGLLSAHLGHSADAHLAVATLDALTPGAAPHQASPSQVVPHQTGQDEPAPTQVSTARTIIALAGGLRATIALTEGRPHEALQHLETIGFETWHQWAMTSPFIALARERYLTAELLARTGRDEEAGWWSAALETSTPHDLVYARR